MGSSTGAAKAVSKVIPDVKGKLTGMGNTATSYDDICAEVSRLADGPMTGILGYCDEPLVSTDFETELTSSVFDAGAGIMLSQVRQVRRLVRQRVGLLEPRRRPHVPH